MYKEIYGITEKVGKLIAQNGGTLFTVGPGGVMDAASKGAKEARGLTVGILPGFINELTYCLNEYKLKINFLWHPH